MRALCLGCGKVAQLYAISEPAYITSAWYLKSLSGLQDAAHAQRISFTMLDNVEEIYELPSINTVVLIGSDLDWTNYHVSFLRNLGIRIVLLGPPPNDFGADVSGALFNRDTLVRDMVRYFHQFGRTRLALLGTEPNLSNDNLRRSAFISAAHFYSLELDVNRDIYDYTSSLRECIEDFLGSVGLYNGVLCANDYVAVELIVSARERGILIPEQLFVAGSGNLLIGSCTLPTLTTSTLDYYELGQQTVNLWQLLENNPGVVSVTVNIPSRIIARGSTAFLPVGTTKSAQRIRSEVQEKSLEDPVVVRLRKLEACLLACDQLDYSILRGILRGKSTETLAASLFVSPGTVQYRLKKMYSALDVNSRAEFIDLLSYYIASLETLKNENILAKDNN